MRVVRSFAFAGTMAIAGSPLVAQVDQIQITPADITMQVGDRESFLATPFDARGNPIGTSDIRWSSSNLNVIRVEFDPSIPNVVEVVAVGPGLARVEARSGNVTEFRVIQVQPAPAPQPPPDPTPPTPPEPVVPDSVLPADVSAASISSIARIEPSIYGTAPACRVGGFVGANLLVTSYLAVRGADAITAVLSDGQRINGVRVAAFDATQDMAVLQVPVQRQGEMTVGTAPAANQFVWVVGLPNCDQPASTRQRVAAVAPSATGQHRLTGALGQGQLGAPVVDRSGALIGVASGGAAVIPSERLQRVIDEARQNLAAGTLQTPADVAGSTQHAHGSLVLRSQMLGAIARIRPMELWQWPELTTEGNLPLTFAGPVGRYEVDLVAGGEVQNTQVFTMRPGVATQVQLTPRVVAPVEEPTPQPPPGAEITPQGGGGGFPVALLLLGLAGGGAAAFFLTQGGDTTTVDPPGGPGGIRISIPATLLIRR